MLILKKNINKLIILQAKQVLNTITAEKEHDYYKVHTTMQLNQEGSHKMHNQFHNHEFHNQRL